MFNFVQWDSPLIFLLEFLLAVAVIVAVMWIGNRANLDSPPRPAPTLGDEDNALEASPLNSVEDPNMEETPQSDRQV